MKTVGLLLFVVFICLDSTAQPYHEKDCKNEHSDILKSDGNHCVDPLEIAVDLYRWNDTTRQWYLDQMYSYTYDTANRPVLIEVYNKPLDSYQYQYQYFYESSGLLVRRYLRNYENGSWMATSRYLYYYDGNQNLTMMLVQVRDGKLWLNSERFLYQYDMTNISSVIRQRYINQQWSDHSWSEYTYDSYCNITEITDYRFSDNMPYRRNLYLFENHYRIQVRLIQQMSENAWENVTRVLYKYDPLNREKIRINQSYEDGTWVNSVKRTFTYQTDDPVKVELCHRGIPICVSYNAVRAHLAHISVSHRSIEMKPFI